MCRHERRSGARHLPQDRLLSRFSPLELRPFVPEEWAVSDQRSARLRPYGAGLRTDPPTSRPVNTRNMEALRLLQAWQAPGTAGHGHDWDFGSSPTLFGSLGIPPDVGAISFMPQVRRVPCSDHLWPSWPTPSLQSCWQAQSRRPWWAAAPTMP